MQTRKYGNIRSIWARTGGKCHLCHQAVDLDTYGLVSLYGSETASIDHLTPQSWGGDHDHDNLRIAHQGCNSSRGTRDFVEAREELSGRSWEPLSAGERFGTVLFSTLALGFFGAGLGVAATNPTSDLAGRKRAQSGALLGAICLGAVGLIAATALTE